MFDGSFSGGIGKFATIIVYAVVLFGLVLSLGQALLIWMNTGDYKPTIEATAGQLLYWDNQIYDGVQWLKDDTSMTELPQSFRDEFKDYVVRQIFFYLVLFAIIAFFLYKGGIWLSGQAGYDASTKVAIIAIIFLVIFPATEFAYGYLMYKETVVPYRGVAELFKPSTWKVMFSDTNTMYADYNSSIESTRVFNIAPGG